MERRPIRAPLDRRDVRSALTGPHLRRCAPLAAWLGAERAGHAGMCRRYAYIFAASEIGLKHEVRNDLEVTLMHSLTHPLSEHTSAPAPQVVAGPFLRPPGRDWLCQ